MAKATPIISAFNAGEWSPLLDGRVDLAGYGASAYVCENFLPTVQGPNVRRGGTRYVGDVDDHTKRSWLVPFRRSRSVSYVIEFGDSVCRFWFNRAQVLDGMSPYEIASPYTAAQLVLASGEFALDWEQSGDVLYLTHRSGAIAPRKLSRTSSTSWAFSTLNPNEGPYGDTNATATTMYSSASTGSVTITASSSVFTADHVGALIRLEPETITIAPWQTDIGSVSADAPVRHEGRGYFAADSGTVGTSPPVHTKGTVSDGGVPWTYRDSGYGVARITAQSGTTATATVIKAFPIDTVASPSATTFWKFGAWSFAEGFPETVSFFNERLCFGKGQTLYLSQVADYENFAPDVFGEITAESAVTVTLQSSEVNEIVGLLGGDVLEVYTEGAEFTVAGLTSSEPFGPGNVKVVRASGYGGATMRPLKVGEASLFMQAGSRKLREIVFDIQVNNLVSRDMTVRSDHITWPGIIAMARQEEPYQLVWALRSDGVPLVFTYDRTQEVRGWAREPMGGIVESIAVIPSPDGTVDDVWVIVRREIDGGTVRYVEYVEQPFRFGDADDAYYVDCGLTYDGTAATTISGLDHLEGETVHVLADAATHPDAVVSGGEITLERAASVVHVGLPCPAVWASNRIEAGASDGTSQTKTKRITDVSFRVYQTLGGKAGPSLDRMDDIPGLTYRSAYTAMDSGSPFMTGDMLVSWPSGYETAGRIWYMNDRPLPAMLVAVVPQVVTQEAR